MCGRIHLITPAFEHETADSEPVLLKQASWSSFDPLAVDANSRQTQLCSNSDFMLEAGWGFCVFIHSSCHGLGE